MNFANMVGAIIGMILLTKVGRKPLLLVSSLFMAGCMLGMGFAYNAAPGCPDPSNCLPATLELYFCVGFVVFFELGMGVIPWLYMAEIMTNSAMSAGVVTNQVFTLLISLLSNSLLIAMDGWVFVMFGGISIAVSFPLFLFTI